MPTHPPGETFWTALLTFPIARTQSSKLSFCWGEELTEMGASPIPKTETCTNWPAWWPSGRPSSISSEMRASQPVIMELERTLASFGR
jgi:hypothetical protein